jgi:hypothetical protein
VGDVLRPRGRRRPPSHSTRLNTLRRRGTLSTMPRPLALVACWLAITAALVPRIAAADGAWLDQPISVWNAPGMNLPRAPGMDPATNPQCLSDNRPIETDADQALADAGWTLFGGYQGGWNTLVVRGLSGYDGMCRPLGYNEFVFVDGDFAGTISPELMDSRTDGVGDVRFFAAKDSLAAQFQRYAPTDPLCCPSATMSVTYKIVRTANGPVLVPQSVTP